MSISLIVVFNRLKYVLLHAVTEHIIWMSSSSLCDKNNFDQFYQKWCREIRNFLYYKCGDLDRAEDLMQDTFVRIWKKCKEVIIDKAMGLAFSIAGNLFIDLVRKDKVSLSFQKQLSVSTNREDPYFQLRSAEFQEKIEQEIADLPEGQRTAFLMNRIDKMTYKEIAQRLEISETAVEKRISKALAKLRDRIEELKRI